MGFLNVFDWRDAASVSCACWAGVLDDRAVNVGQNSGLTARNTSHGEVTAIDQSPDHRRGDVQTPRDPGLRNPRTSNLENHEPRKRIELSLTLSIRGFRLTRHENETLQPHPLRGHGERKGQPTSTHPGNLLVLLAPRVRAHAPARPRRPLEKKFLTAQSKAKSWRILGERA